MSTDKWAMRAGLALALAVLAVASPRLVAAPNDSAEIASLLTDAKQESAQLQMDTERMQTFAQSQLTWQTFASQITEIKTHVNNIGVTVGKLNNVRGQGSAWQQQAIDRINPLLKELAASVEATIKQLNEHQGRVHSTHYRDYVDATHEEATDLAALVSDYVEYGRSKDKMEALAKDLEVPER